MVLMQASAKQEPRVEAFRNKLLERIADKHEDTLCKFGAIVASGLLDAGGRNVTIALRSASGHTNMSSVVGLAVFTAFWYWHPLLHFVSLAFTPTAFVALNADMALPVVQLRSNAKPSLFAYPPDIKLNTTTAVKQVAQAVLSTAAKAKQRKKDKEDKEGAAGLAATSSASAAAMDVDPAPADKKEGETKPEEVPEAEFELLSNPCRVTPVQGKYLSVIPTARYVPIRPVLGYGFVMVADSEPGQPQALVDGETAEKKPAAAAAAVATPKAASAPAPMDTEAAAPDAFVLDD